MASFEQMIPNVDKALMLAKRDLSLLAYDAVQLEGINFTLPEIQTLLDGVTVGGHKLSDQQVARNQAEAWRKLFDDIHRGLFSVSEEYVVALHGIAGKEGVLEWGAFRSGGVTISGSSYMLPKARTLSSLFEALVCEHERFDDAYDKAIYVFLSMARNQFFYDVNKRMGRFMMNGVLLAQGYPAINVPVKRQLEFNQLMLDFYESNNQLPMNVFLRSCLDQRIVEIMSE
ncbi:MAG: Fic family protein [Pseudomonadales bacterium]|nr:Fic family protein [Pseudomonadales bacterium]